MCPVSAAPLNEIVDCQHDHAGVIEMDIVAGVHGVHVRAVLEFDGPLIASLREYWASECVGEPGTAPGQPGP